VGRHLDINPACKHKQTQIDKNIGTVSVAETLNTMVGFDNFTLYTERQTEPLATNAKKDHLCPTNSAQTFRRSKRKAFEETISSLGMLATIRCRIFSLPGCYPKTQRLGYTEL
jgi:hypothetical protein